MRIENKLIFPLEGTDENGSKVPANSDTVLLRRLVEGEPENPQEEQEAVEEFEHDIKKVNGYLAINENFETTYIPPYDDIAAVIRHKCNGNEFIIVDLSKTDKKVYITATKINETTEV